MFSSVADNHVGKLKKTRQHYDTYPYEVDVRDSEAYSSNRTHVGRFISEMSGGSALDLGCGPGNLLPVIARRANETVGLDVSRRSLRNAAQAVRGLPVTLVQASALELPFADESFDWVLATGSLHHTPDARAGFREACRVLHSGGRAFVAVYRAASYYSLLYNTLGWVARGCDRFGPARLIVNRWLLMPLFALYLVAGRLIVHRRLAVPSYRQIVNYFADQMLNPVVTFHSMSEVSEWAESAGVRIGLIAYSHGRSLINFEIRRDTQEIA